MVWNIKLVALSHRITFLKKIIDPKKGEQHFTNMSISHFTYRTSIDLTRQLKYHWFPTMILSYDKKAQIKLFKN